MENQYRLLIQGNQIKEVYVPSNSTQNIPLGVGGGLGAGIKERNPDSDVTQPRLIRSGVDKLVQV